MKDFAVGTAHGGEPMTISQNLRQTRVNHPLVVMFVLDDRAGDQAVRFPYQGVRLRRFGLIKFIGDRVQSVETWRQHFVIAAKGAGFA